MFEDVCLLNFSCFVCVCFCLCLFFVSFLKFASWPVGFAINTAASCSGLEHPKPPSRAYISVLGFLEA